MVVFDIEIKISKDEKNKYEKGLKNKTMKNVINVGFSWTMGVDNVLSRWILIDAVGWIYTRV